MDNMDIMGNNEQEVFAPITTFASTKEGSDWNGDWKIHLAHSIGHLPDFRYVPDQECYGPVQEEHARWFEGRGEPVFYSTEEYIRFINVARNWVRYMMTLDWSHFLHRQRVEMVETDLPKGWYTFSRSMANPRGHEDHDGSSMGWSNGEGRMVLLPSFYHGVAWTIALMRWEDVAQRGEWSVSKVA